MLISTSSGGIANIPIPIALFDILLLIFICGLYAYDCIIWKKEHIIIIDFLQGVADMYS